MLDKVESLPLSSKDFKKQKLIEATISTISEYGLSKTTISRVTRAANMSAGIVNFHFDSKEMLLLGTLQSMSDEFRKHIQLALDSSHQPIEKLKAIIDTYFSPPLCDVEKIAVWWAFCSESGARAEYMKICGDQDTWFQEMLLVEIRRMCVEHDIPEAKATAISRGIEGVIDGYWQEYLYQPDNFDIEQAKSTCLDFLDTVFPGSVNENGILPGRDIIPKFSDGLPTWTYYDEEFLELEKQELFRKNWLLVGHISDIPGSRDYLTLDAVGERAIVIRGNDNVLRAFHNVCRHRGAKLKDSRSGQCAHALSCPFHGWTYQLDGKLIAVPAEKTFDSLDKTMNGLVPLDLETWMGFIFVRFDSSNQGEVESLEQQMKPVEQYFEPYQIEKMVPLANSYYEETRPYNWKIIHDIDNEGYHVPVGHPSLQQLYGKSYVDTDINGLAVSYAYINEKPARLWSVKSYQKLLPEFDHLPEQNQKLWFYGTLFPSMVIGLYPDSIEFYMTLPLTTKTTLYRGSSYALPDSRPGMDAIRYLNRRINRETEIEDESFVRWMQEGMQSSAFPESKLSSLESGVRSFHKKIQARLPVANLLHHPGTGHVREINNSLTPE